MKLVFVVWEDAFSADFWMPKSGAEDLSPLMNKSVGFVVKDNERFLSIAQTYNDSDHINNLLVLPKRSIHSVQEQKLSWK